MKMSSCRVPDDPVVMVRVRRQTQTPDGLKAYKVRVKRFLKASDKVRVLLTKGLIYTLPGTCQVSLQPRTTYVITGNVEAGKPWTNLCHFTKPWNSLSPKMKKGFRLLYQSGCDCPIMSCHYWERCPKASFMCAWETANEIDDCQGRHAVCLRSANGTCGWLGGRLYRACMKRRRSRTSKATYKNDIEEDNNSRTSKVSYKNNIAEDNNVIPRYKEGGNDRHLVRSNSVSTNKRRLTNNNESKNKRRLNNVSSSKRKINNSNESTIKRNHSNRIRKPSRSYDETTQDLWDVLGASARILHYYKEHMTDMNMDAVLGTSMAEGQYAIIMEALDSGTMVPCDIEAMEVLRQLLTDIRTFNTKASDFIRKAYPDYNKSLGRMMAPGFYEIPLTFLHLENSSLPYKDFDNLRVLQGVEQLHEDESDACLTEVLTGEQKKHQHKRNIKLDFKHLDNDDYLVNEIAQHFLRHRRLNKGFDPSRCLISGWCWSTMTGRGYSGYSLTHQLFYLINAMQSGCRTQIDDIIAGSGREPLEEIITGLCTNVLMEARALVEADYPEMRKDLFMEQGVFCGQLGFDNFFPRTWICQVLSWQRDIGCYGDFLFYKANQKPDDAHNRIKREQSSMPGYTTLYLFFV